MADMMVSAVPMKRVQSHARTLSSGTLSRTMEDLLPGERSRHDMIVISCSDDTYSDAEQRQYGFYDLETDGALRGGGKRSLFTAKTIGLLLNYAGIGVMYGALPSTILPFLKYYLNMESYQVQAASAVVNTAWGYKMFGGMISDSLPMFGYRRKSYMILGWLICSCCLTALALFPMPEPYFYPGSRDIQNKEAPNRGWMYALTMAGATFGYFFANVASDAMVVEYSQREPMHSRGETQTIIYATRSVFMMFSDVFIGTAMNDARFGGKFTFSLDYNIVMLILAVVSLVPLFGSIFLLHEDTNFSCMSFAVRCREMWRIAQSRAVWQVLMFELIAGFCLSFTSSAGVSVATAWAKVEPFQRSIASVVTGIIYSTSLYLTKTYLLQVSWIKLFCVTTVWIVFVRFIYVSCTIFDVVRDQHFWLYMQTFVQPASAVRFLLFTFPITEIAEVGFEGTTFGLVVTFHNMAIPLGVSASKSANSFFNITDKKVRGDSPDIRWTVYYTYLIAWAVQLSSMLALFLLPRQKLEIQQLRYYGGYSKKAGVLVLFVLVFVLVYSTTTNALSLFKDTACLRIAGGGGCSNSKNPV